MSMIDMLDKKQRRLTMLTIAFGLGLLFTAHGQGASEPRFRLRVKDLDVNLRRTPLYQAESTPYAKSEDDWLQLLLTYEVDVEGGKWVDRLQLKWHVALLQPSGKPLLLNRAIDYVDVEKGECHAVVYVRPGLLKRYFKDGKIDKDQVLVHVVFKANGSVVETFEHRGTDNVPQRWWDAGPAQVVTKTEELLPRTKTPFAPLDYDYYEHISE